MCKIVYITVKAPFGRLGETYILPEILAIQKSGIDLMIVPRDLSKELYHERAESLRNITVSMPRFNRKIAKELSKYITKYPASFFKLIKKVVFEARSFRVGIKNLIIIPKGIYLSKILVSQSVSHIHAHYGSTTSTMAYIISEITGIPWSFTVHRWDITENNLLKNKCKSAAFVRAIDEKGRDEMVDIVEDISLSNKISLIHVGVDIPESSMNGRESSDIYTFLCPAVFVPKKGHQYLFQACEILSQKKDVKFKCLIAGEGPLEFDLKKIIADLKLNTHIEFLGPLSQDQLYTLYSSQKINAVVLPSIVTKSGEKEGIPVALMEAMSYGIPVISTNTGGIPELIGDGNGIMINEKDPEAIAGSMLKLMNNKNYYQFVSEKSRQKVEKDFNISLISKELLGLFSQYSSN